MAETLSKISLYLRPTKRYWVPTSAAVRAADPWAYPIDFAPRLDDGHFRHFDDSGIPLRPTPRGPIHNYTRICGWALAHWSRAMSGARPEESRASFLAAAQYIRRTAVPVGADLELKAELPGAGHVGAVSSMAQGQAMSVLVRAERVTGDPGYGDAAERCLGPFRRTCDEGGVAATMREVDGTWFEEDPVLPPRHILNGMVFALWGLEDLARRSADSEGAVLHEAGMRALHGGIGRFDLGWWSTYDAPDAGRRYIASMRYHDLHVAQLEALAVGEPALRTYADRFARYAGSIGGRLRAGAAMATAKARRDYRHDDRGSRRPPS